MNEEKYLDFDQFLNEAQEAKGPVVKVYGEEIQLAPEMPAIVMVSTLRMLRSNKDEVALEELISMTNTVFGADNVSYWLEEKGMGIEALSQLLEKVIALYNKTPRDKQPVTGRQRPNITTSRD